MTAAAPALLSSPVNLEIGPGFDIARSIHYNGGNEGGTRKTRSRFLFFDPRATAAFAGSSK